MDEVKAKREWNALDSKKEQKRSKREAKKARLKSAARVKHWMEVSRTICSLAALAMATVGLLHSYHLI